MRLYYRLLIAGILAVMVALLVAAPGAAQTTSDLTGRGFTDVNIRALPGANSSVLGVLPANEEFVAIGRTPGNSWIQIQYLGTTGWIAAWLPVFSADTALLPIVTEIEPPLYGEPGPFEVLMPFNTNLRSQPTTDSTIVETASFGTTGSAIQRSGNSSWVLLKFNGTEGWVAAWLVVIRGDINQLPVDDTLVIPTTPGSAPTLNSPRATPTPGPSPTPRAETVDIPAGALTARAPFRVNVRSEPDTTASVVEVLAYGETVEVLGRNTGNNWLQIRTGSVTGWVARWVVNTPADTAGLPITDDSENVSVVSGAVNIFGLYDLLMRSGPSTSTATIAVLPAVTSVPAVARTADSSWIKVSYNNTEGWVASWVLLADADFNNLPVEGATP